MRLDYRKLFLAMANAGMSDTDLCEKSGVSRPALTKIKKGAQSPRPNTVGKLARALGVAVEELMIEVII